MILLLFFRLKRVLYAKICFGISQCFEKSTFCMVIRQSREQQEFKQITLLNWITAVCNLRSTGAFRLPKRSFNHTQPKCWNAAASLSHFPCQVNSLGQKCASQKWSTSPSFSRHFLPEQRRTRRHLSIFLHRSQAATQKNSQVDRSRVVWVSAPRIDRIRARRAHWAAPPHIWSSANTLGEGKEKNLRNSTTTGGGGWWPRGWFIVGPTTCGAAPGSNRRRALITARELARARRMNPQVARCLSRACNPDPLAARAHIFVNQSHAPPPQMLSQERERRNPWADRLVPFVFWRRRRALMGFLLRAPRKLL